MGGILAISKRSRGEIHKVHKKKSTKANITTLQDVDEDRPRRKGCNASAELVYVWGKDMLEFSHFDAKVVKGNPTTDESIFRARPDESKDRFEHLCKTENSFACAPGNYLNSYS